MPLLLEIRVACAFQRNGIRPQYEFSAGSGTKSVDFHVHGTPEWLIEVVSLTESDAVKDATEDDALFTSVVLSGIDALVGEGSGTIAAAIRGCGRGCESVSYGNSRVSGACRIEEWRCSASHQEI